MRTAPQLTDSLLPYQQPIGIHATRARREGTKYENSVSESEVVTCGSSVREAPGSAMALSQCLDDSPLRPGLKLSGTAELSLQEVYNERHRLALELLLSAGEEDFLAFLRRERIPNFLSEQEMERIRIAAVSPHCVSLPGDEQLQQPGDSSVDCSSVTYFPELSDVEPPLLEIGWPAFTAGSYRGVTRAVAHFQPSYGESIYSCKEVVRRMVKAAKEVIAIVTDSLTDLDIFKDLQEACSLRKVPVYILLDQSCAPAFLKMCRNLSVRLDDLRQMRVRTIAGTTYYMRSGARITGNVHERFMLIDGHKVATGSYRFDWSDGRLNSSNLIELSGQITEKFDEEFRILYAQSLPINTRSPPSLHSSGIYEHMVKHQTGCSPHPTRAPPVQHKTSSALNDDVQEEEEEQEILAGITATLPFHIEEQPPTVCCHASTQTNRSVMDSDTQTDPVTPTAPRGPPPQAPATTDPALNDCFHKLSKGRRFHYSTIRSKVEHMVSVLTERRQLTDITNMAPRVGNHGHGRQRIRDSCEQDTSARRPVDAGGVGTWPRARCVH
ncbi:protein FAM83D isoform X2 [Gouania willdenowi]|uniref:Protein FAM83D-like n=1 Tax=Gouania willdenowi TaxID=441366 RepID=A0A8C5FYE5_GOUWI|nr:protein FAM83D-like isoform X2 [Gouania willdenowi]